MTKVYRYIQNYKFKQKGEKNDNITSLQITKLIIQKTVRNF